MGVFYYVYCFCDEFSATVFNFEIFQPASFGVSVRGPGQREQAGGEYLFCGMYNTNNSKCFWHLEYFKIHFVHFFMNVFPHFNICFTTSQGSG